MINLLNAQKLSFKKIKFNKGKSLFIIIPIAIMFTIIVMAASEAKNLVDVVHESIFSPIQSQNEIIELDKNSSTAFGRNMDTESTDTGYAITDNTIISAIPNVEKVDFIASLPIDIIKSSDLFDGQTINMSSMAGIDQEFAALYTDKNFTYTDNAAIPIILNANDFNIDYEDWGGQTEISIDFAASADPSQATELTNQTPMKTKAIPYDRDNLIGKTFTIQFGGLATIGDINQETTTTGIKYTQKTAEAIATETEALKTAISKYWDYDMISTPITYTFEIVGISEGTDKTTAFVPTEFANVLIEEYFANEIAARNTVAFDATDLNSTYTGLIYDGVSISSDSTSNIFALMRNQLNDQVNKQFDDLNTEISDQNAAINSANTKIRTYNNTTYEPGTHGGPPSMPKFNTLSTISALDTSGFSISYPGSATTYAIPGLVYEKDRTTNEITGEYTSFDFSQSLPIPSTTALIKIASTDSRTQVVSDLNAKGYRYQDFSEYEQYAQLESYLYVAVDAISIIFMVVTALLILLNMAKFVSESKREIGIFRAIGATKGDIRLIITVQTMEYIVISIVFGGLLGFVAVYGLSSFMATSAQSVINMIIGSSMVISKTMAASSFANLDLEMIGIYAAILLVVTLIVSLIPSRQAANISPVEAIRNA